MRSFAKPNSQLEFPFSLTSSTTNLTYRIGQKTVDGIQLEPTVRNTQKKLKLIDAFGVARALDNSVINTHNVCAIWIILLTLVIIFGIDWNHLHQHFFQLLVEFCLSLLQSILGWLCLWRTHAALPYDSAKIRYLRWPHNVAANLLNSFYIPRCLSMIAMFGNRAHVCTESLI